MQKQYFHRIAPLYLPVYYYLLQLTIFVILSLMSTDFNFTFNLSKRYKRC